MEEWERRKRIKKSFNIGIIVLITLLSLYLGIVIYNLYLIDKYKTKVFPNVYLEKYKIEKYEFLKLNSQIDFFNKMIEQESIIILCNGKEYNYTYKDLGILLDKERIKKEIKLYQDSLSYSEKIMALNTKKKKVYSYRFKCDEIVLRKFLTSFKQQVDVSLKNGYFNVNNYNVEYISGVDSFSLDIESAVSDIKRLLDGDSFNSRIVLIGKSEKANYDESYRSIDTKVSSFSTEFNTYLYSRVTNLRTALNYINGAIVKPGEVFSFYDYAGPYNKQGYVFYYEFVGNGVCQIATTIYNTALLGGLSIVKRYPHKAKSVYIAGGLDATVASYSSGWNVDFQFKNTYKYPIYISAYMLDNKVYVDFWSNHAAMEGKTYATESIQIGVRGYTTYLYTYKDGVQIDKKKIATTWYSED